MCSWFSLVSIRTLQAFVMWVFDWRRFRKVKAKIYLLKKLIMESGLELKDREAARKEVVEEFTKMEVRHPEMVAKKQ